MTTGSPLHIEKTIHVNQLLGDFDAANRFYEDVFGAVGYMTHYDEYERRDASLFVIGDTSIELFGPRDTESMLGRSLARFGDSFHSFEWKVADLEEAKTILDGKGVRLATYRPGAFLMTHPKDTHGMVIELCPLEMPGDPRIEPGWSAAPWRDQHPMQIDRLNAMSFAVTDADATAAFLTELTGCEVGYREQRAGAGDVVGLWIADTFVELVQPGPDGGPVAAYIDRVGPRLRSLHFRVRDVDAAGKYLQDKGLRVIDGDVDGWIAIDPRDNCGVLWQFTEDLIANDPRGSGRAGESSAIR